MKFSAPAMSACENGDDSWVAGLCACLRITALQGRRWQGSLRPGEVGGCQPEWNDATSPAGLLLKGMAQWPLNAMPTFLPGSLVCSTCRAGPPTGPRKHLVLGAVRPHGRAGHGLCYARRPTPCFRGPCTSRSCTYLGGRRVRQQQVVTAGILLAADGCNRRVSHRTGAGRGVGGCRACMGAGMQAHARTQTRPAPAPLPAPGANKLMP